MDTQPGGSATQTARRSSVSTSPSVPNIWRQSTAIATLEPSSEGR
ncbi:hypothetical protein [Pseudonocardia zijingensis]